MGGIFVTSVPLQNTHFSQLFLFLCLFLTSLCSRSERIGLYPPSTISWKYFCINLTTKVWVGKVKPRCHLQISPWRTTRVLFSSRPERAGIETEKLGGSPNLKCQERVPAYCALGAPGRRGKPRLNHSTLGNVEKTNLSEWLLLFPHHLTSLWPFCHCLQLFLWTSELGKSRHSPPVESITHRVCS